jgi:hypothetical protein
MGQAILLVSAIVAPVALLILNVILRSGRGLPQSTAADVLLLLPALDATIILDPASFQQLVPDQNVRGMLGALSMGSLFICLVSWSFAVTYLEKWVLAYYDARRRRYTSRKFMIPLFSSWIIAGCAIATHILIFSYHSPITTK